MTRHIAVVAAAFAATAMLSAHAHAEGRWSFINTYIEKYAKVKDGDKIAGFDLNRVSSESSFKKDEPRSLASYRNRLKN